LIAIAVLLIGCKAESALPSATPELSGSGTPQPTATFVPTATPVPCSREAAAVATLVPNEIEVVGSDDFKTWTERALRLLEERAPDAYREVSIAIRTIESVSAGSGMYVIEKRFAVGEQTAHAPDYDEERQLLWYASAIVHDAYHSALCASGEPYTGMEAEIQCLMVQKAALELLTDDAFFASYIQGLIDGADDPVNQYWNNPDRHW
jgi:hypothetical protein